MAACVFPAQKISFFFSAWIELKVLSVTPLGRISLKSCFCDTHRRKGEQLSPRPEVGIILLGGTPDRVSDLLIYCMRT